MPLFYVKIRKNIDICNYLPIYYPAICRGWGTFSVPSLGEGWDGAFGEGWDGAFGQGLFCGLGEGLMRLFCPDYCDYSVYCRVLI